MKWSMLTCHTLVIKNSHSEKWMRSWVYGYDIEWMDRRVIRKDSKGLGSPSLNLNTMIATCIMWKYSQRHAFQPLLIRNNINIFRHLALPRIFSCIAFLWTYFMQLYLNLFGIKLIKCGGRPEVKNGEMEEFVQWRRLLSNKSARFVWKIWW